MIIPLNLLDTQKDRVINALASNYNYQDTIDDKPNPETKSQFAKKQIIMFLKENVKAYETKVEQEKISVLDNLLIT